MTTNAFIFSWDQTGVEAIIPITKYEDHDKEAMWDILNNREAKRNPLNSIIQQLILRARANQHRHYEIYSVDCAEGMTEESWRDAWTESPQECADLIRKRGQKLYSDRTTVKQVIT